MVDRAKKHLTVTEVAERLGLISCKSQTLKYPLLASFDERITRLQDEYEKYLWAEAPIFEVRRREVCRHRRAGGETVALRSP